MVYVCCVTGCKTSYRRNPELIQSRFTSKNTKYPELVKKRKNAWCRVLGIDPNAKNLNYLSVCSKHFINGRAANLKDISNPDWVPSLNLGPIAAMKNKRSKQKRKDKDSTNEPLQASGRPASSDESVGAPMDYEENTAGSEDTIDATVCDTSQATVTKDIDPISTDDPANSLLEPAKTPASVQKCHRTCDVYNCSNDSLEFPDLAFHSFPKDECKRKIWTDFCGRRDNWKPKTNSRICSIHFQTDDYELASLMGFKRKNILKPGVCPSMYVESIECSEQDDNDDNDKNQKVVYNIKTAENENIKRNANITCSVNNCKNNFESMGNKLQFHPFPPGPVKRKIWTRFCLRESKWIPTEDSRICSEHFKETDYEHSQLGPLKSMLKINANPSKSNESRRKKCRIQSFGAVSNVATTNRKIRDLNNEITELKAMVGKLLKRNKILNENVENQINYIETVENMWRTNDQRVKELEDFLKDLSELHEEQKNNGSSTHSERIKQIEMMLSKPSIKCNCKILRQPRNCCNMVFPNKVQYDTHIRNMHSKYLPLNCHLCARSFANQAGLTMHLKRHLGNEKQCRSYTCTVCQKEFDDSSNFEAHLLEHHSDNGPSATDSVSNAAETITGDNNFGVIIVENETVPSSSVTKKEVDNDLNSMKNDLMDKGFEVVIEYPPDHDYGSYA